MHDIIAWRLYVVAPLCGAVAGQSSWLVIRKKVHLRLAPTQQHRINDLIEWVGRTAEEKLEFGFLELLEMILRFSVAMFTNNSPRPFWK